MSHRKNLSKLNVGESQTTFEMEEEGLITFSTFRETLDKVSISLSLRDQRVLWRYLQDNYIRSKKVPVANFYPMFKQFILNAARARNIETIRNKCSRSCNLFVLNQLCGIDIKEEEQLDIDADTRKEIDRVRIAAQRLPTDVNEKDTRKRDWLFQRFDIGKTGRLVMAAVDNMMHVQFGDVAYDVKDVIRASFRATKHVSGEDMSSSYNQIERSEFRLLLLALKSHLQLFVAFTMIDSSGDRSLDFSEFKKALPLLEKWGVDITDPRGLFDMIDMDHSGEVSFSEFVHWALKEAIIADLELREKLSHQVEVGDQVLLLGDFLGQIGRVVGWNKPSKQWIIELESGDRVMVHKDEFANGSATNEVLPAYDGNPIHYIDTLCAQIMPGSDHPWIRHEPIRIKSEWSNRPGEYHFEIRAIFEGDQLIGKSWARSIKEAHKNAASLLKQHVEKHRKVAEVMQYVNLEVAKERSKEGNRKLELLDEKEIEQRELKIYKDNVWRRDIIGEEEVNLDMFIRIAKDCGATLGNRELRVIFRECKRGNKDVVRILDVDDFFETGKHIDRKTKALREKLLKPLDRKLWEDYVRRSDPDLREQHTQEFDEILAPPKSYYEEQSEMTEDYDEDDFTEESKKQSEENEKRTPKKKKPASTVDPSFYEDPEDREPKKEVDVKLNSSGNSGLKIMRATKKTHYGADSDDDEGSITIVRRRNK